MMQRRLHHRLPAALGAATLALAALAPAFAPTPAMAIEEPAFERLVEDGDFELRRYAPFVVAETFVDGDLGTASNRGFRLVADYIFGNNRAVRPVADGSERIAMTAPVVVEPTRSEKISMTAPVVVQPQPGAGGAAPASADRWRVAFVMPREYTLTTLPRPNNPAVTLREVPAQQVAVRRFSGLAGEQKVREMTDELLAWVAARGLQPDGTPQLARYNPPWTLPFLRRNEVTVTVRGD
jgi:hypothetical protein